LYGWRARIGFIVPSMTAETMLYEFPMVAPPGVAMVTTNLSIQHLVRDNIGKSLELLKAAAAELARAKVDVIVLGGSPPVTYGGVGFDKEIARQIAEVTDIPGTTSQTGAVEALRWLGVRKVIIASPFAEDQNLLLKKFLEDSGFTVVGVKGLGVPLIDIGRMPAAASAQRAKDAFRAAPDAEGIYMPCAQMPTFRNIAPLERDLGVPVVTSFQGMLWHVFEMLRIREPIHGYGRLLESLAG
jgi:maleate isomerase